MEAEPALEPGGSKAEILWDAPSNLIVKDKYSLREYPALKIHSQL